MTIIMRQLLLLQQQHVTAVLYMMLLAAATIGGVTAGPWTDGDYDYRYNVNDGTGTGTASSGGDYDYRYNVNEGAGTGTASSDTTCTTSTDTNTIVPILPIGVEAAPGGRHGNFLVMKGDQYVGPSLRETGEWSEGEVEQIFQHFVTDGSIVIDAGANIGAHTVALAKLVGDTGLVHAIEPVAILYNLVITNAVLNGLHTVRGHNAYAGAVSSSNGHRSPVINAMVFYVDRFLPDVLRRQVRWPVNFGSLDWAAFQSHDLHRSVAMDYIPTVAVDDFQLYACDFIKIDVEGHEVPVLQGMQRTITTYHPAIYLEDDRGKESSSQITSYLSSLEYTCAPHKIPYYNHYNYKNGDPWSDEVAWVVGRKVTSAHNQLCLHTSQYDKLQEIVQSWGPIPYGAPLHGDEPRPSTTAKLNNYINYHEERAANRQQG